MIDTQLASRLMSRFLGAVEPTVEAITGHPSAVRVRDGARVWLLREVSAVEVLVVPGAVRLFEAMLDVIGGPPRMVGIGVVDHDDARYVHDLREAVGLMRMCAQMTPQQPEPLSTALLVCRFVAPYLLDYWPVEVAGASLDVRRSQVRFQSRFRAIGADRQIVEGLDAWTVDRAGPTWTLATEPLERRPVESP